MYSPTIEGKVYQVEVVVPGASTEGNVPQVEIVGGGQVKAMFDAQEALVGLVVQYVGATDETYHNGYFYKVVALGTTPETYGWQRVNVQPGGSGGGSVNSVNDIEPDVDGNVELTGANINATVGTSTTTIQGHLGTLSTAVSGKITNPTGGTAGQYLKKTATSEEWADVQSGATKNVITLTGDSGTLTSEQIAQVLDDTAVLEIVCDGEVFRLSNKDSTLTYRTFINTNCEASETVSFKVIYVQLNSEAVNYGAWTLEEVSAGGSEPTVETITGNTPTIANVQGNHIYNCTGTLTSLTLTAVETTYAEATIYMTTGSSITVDIPASVKTIGYTEFSPNTSYIISFANNSMVIGEINA